MRFRSLSLARMVQCSAFAAALALGSSHLWADADGAKKDLKDAQTAFDNNDAKTAGDEKPKLETSFLDQLSRGDELVLLQHLAESKRRKPN